MITFRKLTASDCFSYSRLEFDFKTGLHNIVGDNGSGKSSIPLILQLGLYNKCAKEIKIDASSNLITGQPFDIIVQFTKGSKEYCIENNRKQGFIKILENKKNISQKGIPANLKLIEEIIGCNFERFVSLTYQCVDSSIDLLDESKDSARKQFIDGLLNFSELDFYLDKFESKRKELSGKNGRLALLSEQIKTLESAITPLQEFSEDEQDTTELLAGISLYEKQKDNLKSILSDLKSDLKKTVEVLESAEKNKKVSDRIAFLREEITRFKLPPMSLEEATVKLIKSTHDKSEYESEKKQAEQEIRNLKIANKTGKCDSCGSGVPEGFYAKRIEELAEKIVDLSDKIDLEGVTSSVLNTHIKAHNNYNKLVNESNSLKATPNINVNIELESKIKEDLEHNIRFTSDNLGALEEELQKVKSDYQVAEKYNQQVRAVKELNRKITESNHKIRLNVDSSKKELTDLEKKLYIYVLWLDLIAKFKLTKMTKFLNHLNSTLKFYLKMLCNNSISCRFYVDTNGKIAVELCDIAKSQPYSNWSSGQKARIRLSVLFAIQQLLEERNKVSFNVLVLDEVLASLDLNGREGLAWVMCHLKSEGKAVYVISHSDIFNSVLFDSVINVELKDGISNLT